MYATASDIGHSTAAIFLCNGGFYAACGWSAAALTANAVLKIFNALGAKTACTAGMVVGLVLSSPEERLRYLLIGAWMGGGGLYLAARSINMLTITIANLSRTICGFPNRHSSDGLVFRWS